MIMMEKRRYFIGVCNVTDVIHTVGPQGEIPDVLQACYTNSLNLLVQNGLKSVVRRLFLFFLFCSFYFYKT